MSFATDIHSFESGMVNRMRASFDMARRAAATRRVYRTTIDELSSLNQRELDDLGIHRENIRDVAYEAEVERAEPGRVATSRCA